jgi:hypothetical protein
MYTRTGKDGDEGEDEATGARGAAGSGSRKGGVVGGGGGQSLCGKIDRALRFEFWGTLELGQKVDHCSDEDKVRVRDSINYLRRILETQRRCHLLQ